jgi:hypothetical protein
MPPPSDLPAWLRRASDRAAGAPPRRRRAAAAAGFALVLFGAGGVTGFLVAGRHVAAQPPAPPACPPVIACAEPSPEARAPRLHPAAAERRSKPTRAPLQALPERKPLDEGARTQALRAFAVEKAPELRDCIPDPDRGPPLKLGAAFEIAPNGAVDFVQILGADGSPREVRRCYSSRLKRWRFPEELLRGEEKLLVNFVL